jgi:hypothetical protein
VSAHGLREASRSPAHRDRPRTIKTQSMPIVPSAMQVFAANNQNTQPSQLNQQQPSPTLSINSRRSPPAGVQVQRLLPTPPQPNPMINRDESSERDMSPPLPPQHPNPNPHYPRPINRATPQFLTKYQDINLQMNDILAEIERTDYTDIQQPQAPVPNNSASVYPGYPRGQSNSPPRDPAVERVRATERSSPKEVDAGQQRRQQAPRESPKGRDRQPNSPTTSSFTQVPVQQSSEQGVSPPYQSPHTSPGEHHASSNYAQYSRDSPPVIRRTTNAPVADARLPRPSQTPPLQAITTRTPDRSLPVQEEPEDDPGAPSKNGGDTREVWNDGDQSHHEHHLGPSPTPSSDLNGEGGYDETHGGRVSRAGHHDDTGPVMNHENSSQLRFSDGENEESFTPRSPVAGLPDHHRDDYYGGQNIILKSAQTVRGRGRNGSSDQLGLRSFDPAVFEQDQQVLPMGSEHPIPKYAEQRRTQNVQQQAQPQQQQQQQSGREPQPQQYQPQPQNQHFPDPRTSSSHIHEPQYRPPQVLPDDFHNYLDDTASGYLQAYFQSPRPDAPIPPTPHSQTAAPSPSPLLSGGYDNNGKALPPFSPVAPVGSPYPYPYSHVRRTQQISGHSNRPQLQNSNYDPNHPSVIQEQLVRQWQVYAMNNDHGNISDSTFSPSTTPFQGYNPWAFLHTSRMLGGRGRMHDSTMSMQSSPSHEPIALPTPPPILPKKKSMQNGLRKHLSNRKPPPRVESTQPRETSPELSSSGEETAGEEHFAMAEDGRFGGVVAILPADDDKDWIDEEEDDDDLLELEYHPQYVSNVEKRRRRWEIGWENLTQAVRDLLRFRQCVREADKYITLCSSKLLIDRLTRR